MKINWKYALGELTIVTAGILIAFSLNNWAQSRQEQKLERQYLASLKEDIEADRKELEDHLAFLKERVKVAQGVIAHFHRELPGRDTIPTVIFRDLRGMPSFVPHEITYLTLTNSGDLKLIADFEVRNRITEHYNRYQSLYDENKRAEAYVRDHVSPFFMEEASFESMSRDADKLLADHRLRNIVYAWFGIYNIQIGVHEKAIKRCLEMIALLEESL